MNKRMMTMGALVAALLASGCSSHPDPIIDMRGVDPILMQADWDECEGYSEQVIVASGAARAQAGPSQAPRP